jgi:hypothetical protein
VSTPRPSDSRNGGRRAAERPPSRWAPLLVEFRRRRAQVFAAGGYVFAATLAIGVACLVLALADVGPGWLDQAGAVTVSTGFTVGLAIRTGGRPFVFGGLALGLGLLAVLSSYDSLRAGAAVLTVTGTAVLAVMATVPAVRFRTAVREVLVAVGISVVGSLAAVGFRPVVSLERFDYLSLAFSFALAFGLVFRLGAGWHGLGRRGLTVVLIGSLALAISLAYAEMLRRYGSASIVDSTFDAVRWTRDHLGAVPRPLQVLVGFPAMAWGCHMRARRRQGWWVCVYGVAGTASVAGGLMNPATSLLEAALIVAYSLPLGLVLGYGVIRLDLLLTGAGGSRARRAEEAAALRPEPRRFEPLL